MRLFLGVVGGLAKIAGSRCTRLALPGGMFCRAHEEFFADNARAGA